MTAEEQYPSTPPLIARQPKTEREEKVTSMSHQALPGPTRPHQVHQALTGPTRSTRPHQAPPGPPGPPRPHKASPGPTKPHQAHQAPPGPRSYRFHSFPIMQPQGASLEHNLGGRKSQQPDYSCVLRWCASLNCICSLERRLSKINVYFFLRRFSGSSPYSLSLESLILTLKYPSLC